MADNTSYSSHGIISYTSRDYNSIMEEFWRVVPTLTELWTPEADSDPGVVIGKYVASIADMLGVNTDWLANEFLGPAVTQRKNAQKLFGLIGYTLGWYTAARTEVTFTNNSASTDLTFNLGFNGASFSTLTADSDITGQSRIITYNILPGTNTMGNTESRSTRSVVTPTTDVFTPTDEVTLQPGQSTTRVAIEGELRSATYSVASVKQNNYIIKLPSQHVDTTAVWVKARANQTTDTFRPENWVQVSNISEFTSPEPRFAVTYDSYSNAQVQISSYIDALDGYSGYYLTVYWIDCSGVIGCVNADVLKNLMLANPIGSNINNSSDDLLISNLSNTLELPHKYVIAGKSPETGKEAYFNSRNYINTWDSLVTLPDFNRFLNREPGVQCGLVLDCQKALDINISIYQNPNLTDAQKAKLYITNQDFPKDPNPIDIAPFLATQYGITSSSLPFATDFCRYTAMCYAVHNNFQPSAWGQVQLAEPQTYSLVSYKRYKPPVQFIDNVNRDFRPLQNMTVQLAFGYLRVFDFYVVGVIYPKKPVNQSVADNIINNVNTALSLYFDPENREIGILPTLIEIVNVIRNADSNIDYFDAGSLSNEVINWKGCDPSYFNAISFANYVKTNTAGASGITISKDYLID